MCRTWGGAEEQVKLKILFKLITELHNLRFHHCCRRRSRRRRHPRQQELELVRISIVGKTSTLRPQNKPINLYFGFVSLSNVVIFRHFSQQQRYSEYSRDSQESDNHTLEWCMCVWDKLVISIRTDFLVDFFPPNLSFPFPSLCSPKKNIHSFAYWMKKKM